MPRLAPTKDTIRLLFALSGNQCAFPDCTQLLINTKNQFIGQICHIEAALPGGERFNPNQTEEERRHYNNLVLLCYPHHVETNEVQDFSVQKLIDIKKIHEAKYRTSEYQINNDTLNSIASDMEEYWREIERLNTIEHSYSDYAFNIDVKNSFYDVIKSCDENIGHLANFHDTFRDSDESLVDDLNKLIKKHKIKSKKIRDLKYFENPFFNRNWIYHYIGIPNRMTRLKIDLIHLELIYLELYLQQNPDDKESEERLGKLKEIFADLAQNAVVID